jgi:hypothetical protein
MRTAVQAIAAESFMAAPRCILVDAAVEVGQDKGSNGWCSLQRGDAAYHIALTAAKVGKEKSLAPRVTAPR